MIQKKIKKLLAYTPEEIQHLMRCRIDPIYFIENDFKISHSFKEYNGQFKLYDFQKDIINHFSNNKISQCNGPRQFGMTTLMAAYATWMAATQFNNTILVTADRSDSSKHLFEIIRYAISNLPKQYGLNFIQNNKLYLHLDNGTQIVCASSSCGVRGYSCDLLLVDNADFCKPEMLSDLIPAIVWKKATAIFAGQNTDYPNMTISWDKVPDRDEKWKENIVLNIGQEQFNKEMSGKSKV